MTDRQADLTGSFDPIDELRRGDRERQLGPQPVAEGLSGPAEARGRVGSNTKMPNADTAFWLALLGYPCDQEQRARLWNGYIGWKLPPGLRGEKPRSGWPHYVVHAPPGGWPELTGDDRSVLEHLALEHGGHPTWRERTYMDFVGSSFESEVNLSDLTLIDADFSEAQFHAGVQLEGSRFFMQAWFRHATFGADAFFHKTFFEADVHFDRVQFIGFASFMSVEFNGGATFEEAIFESHVDFNDSSFVETHFSGGISVPNLTSFKGVDFRGRASFRNVVFG